MRFIITQLERGSGVLMKISIVIVTFIIVLGSIAGIAFLWNQNNVDTLTTTTRSGTPSRHESTSSVSTTTIATSPIREETVIKVKVFRGQIIDFSIEKGGIYWIIDNGFKRTTEFNRWLFYNAIVKSYDWWKKHFSKEIADLVWKLRRECLENTTVNIDNTSIPLIEKPELILEGKVDVGCPITIRNKFGLDVPVVDVIAKKLMGGCSIVSGQLVLFVYIDRERYLLREVSPLCLEQYVKLYRLGARIDITIVWIDEGHRNCDKTIPGNSGLCSIDSQFAKEIVDMLKVLDYDDIWLLLEVTAAGDNVGGKPVYDFDPEYQWYPDLEGINVSAILINITSKYRDSVILVSSHIESGTLLVKVDVLEKVVRELKMYRLRIGLPLGFVMKTS